MRKKTFFLNQHYEQIYNTKQTFAKGDFSPKTLSYRKNHSGMIISGILEGVATTFLLAFLAYRIGSQDVANSFGMKIGMFLPFMYVAVKFALGINSYSNYIRSAIRYDRLDNSGVIIEGELLEANNSTSDGFKTADLTVVYTFTTPKKHTLIARQSYRRPDLMNKPLPRKGTQVKILYTTDDDYVML